MYRDNVGDVEANTAMWAHISNVTVHQRTVVELQVH